MGFKSAKQRAFLFAMDRDKAKGQNPQQIHAQKSSAQPVSLPPAQAPMPHNIKIGTIKPTATPKLKLPKSTIPALPGLPKPAKFGKIRKFLK